MNFRPVALSLTAMLVAVPALAAGNHAGGHDNSDGHHATMTVGVPGDASKVSRSINVVMKETDSGDMLFEPAQVKVRNGETIRFVIQNQGELEHEFVLDDHAGVMEHKAAMEKFPEMEHDDPNSLRLEPGNGGEVIWQFTNSGDFEFACLIPGHYDAGMKGTLKVSK